MDAHPKAEYGRHSAYASGSVVDLSAESTRAREHEPNSLDIRMDDDFKYQEGAAHKHKKHNKLTIKPKHQTIKHEASK